MNTRSNRLRSAARTGCSPAALPVASGRPDFSRWSAVPCATIWMPGVTYRTCWFSFFRGSAIARRCFPGIGHQPIPNRFANTGSRSEPTALNENPNPVPTAELRRPVDKNTHRHGGRLPRLGPMLLRPVPTNSAIHCISGAIISVELILIWPMGRSNS